MRIAVSVDMEGASQLRSVREIWGCLREGSPRRQGEPFRGRSYALAPLEDAGAWPRPPGGPGMPDSTLTTSNCLFT